jgi:type IV secretion system protein VirB4
MVNISRLLQDYRDAGSLNSLIALWGFIDDTTFLTKAGALGVVFTLEGVDYECLDHEQRREVVHRFEQALRQLDERFRVYQYLLKRRAPAAPVMTHAHPIVAEALARRAEYLASRADQLFTLDLYLVVLFEGWSYRRTVASRLKELLASPLATMGELLSTRRVVRVMDAELSRARVELHDKAQAVAVQLADTVKLAPLGKTDAFRFLRRLFHYTPEKADATLKYDTHLDFFLSDASVECHRDYLAVDDHLVKVLTMKEPPGRTFAHILQGLYAIPAPFIACLEWQRIPDATMRRDIQSRRRHFFNRKVSLVNYVSPQTRPEDMLVDDSAAATVGELGQCLTEIEVHGHFFGSCSLTLLLHDRDHAALNRTAAEFAKVFAAHDGSLFDESYNLLNAWLAVLPGNGAHNLRRLALLNTNYADLSFLFTLQTGERMSTHLGGQEYLAMLETEHHSPYFFNLHVDDVGHALVLGATGSGKSFLVNFLITHAQKYDPTTLIFDLGGSYDRTAARLGGSVWHIGLTHRAFTINPFSLAPTAEHLHFLASFVRVLLRANSDGTFEPDDDRDIIEAVENVYALDPPQRRLITLTSLLSRRLAVRLYPWVQGGPYAEIFDNVSDTLTFQQMQCFNFQGLERYPVVLEPLLFYVLHRASTAVQDDTVSSRLKLFVLDEAWRFARDTTVRAYIFNALKTWRKRNAAMILATQSSDDFAHVDLLRTVIESCPTKLFLANPGMDHDAARDLFHLNETESALIAGLRPRQQFLLKRPDVAKVLNLRVDSQSYWLYTDTPPDNERIQNLAVNLGQHAAVDVLTPR